MLLYSCKNNLCIIIEQQDNKLNFEEEISIKIWGNSGIFHRSTIFFKENLRGVYDSKPYTEHFKTQKDSVVPFERKDDQIRSLGPLHRAILYHLNHKGNPIC